VSGPVFKPHRSAQPSFDIGAISTYYDGRGRPDPSLSLMKVRDGALVNENGDTAMAIQMRPEELARSVIQSGVKLVELTDRSGNTVWVNPQLVTNVRVGVRPTVTIIEQGDIDTAPWDPIQVRETVKAVREQLQIAAKPLRELALTD
jgi:hypothetical protein